MGMCNADATLPVTRARSTKANGDGGGAHPSPRFFEGIIKIFVLLDGRLC